MALAFLNQNLLPHQKNAIFTLLVVAVERDGRLKKNKGANLIQPEKPKREYYKGRVAK